MTGAASKLKYFVIIKCKKKYQLISFSYDFLSIYDGDSSTSYMLGKYCGNSIPPSNVSSNNEVLIHFYSNGYGTEGGFKMEYHPIGKQNNTDYHIDHGLSIETVFLFFVFVTFFSLF